MTENDEDRSLLFELPESDPLFEKKKVRFMNDAIFGSFFFFVHFVGNQNEDQNLGNHLFIRYLRTKKYVAEE